MQRIAHHLMIAVVVTPLTTDAKTRKRSTTKSSRSSAAPKTSDAEHAGAQRVAEQIKILTRFIYLLGGVAKGWEGVVRNSIKIVREGLDKLEIDFRTTPDLQRYYIKLAGVASGAANAEDQAAANQFDKAGRTLLDVVNRLTDVLLEMR